MWRIVLGGCLAAVLVGCEESTRRDSRGTLATLFVEIPNSGDRCFFRMEVRPDDCAALMRPECMYADAVLYLERGKEGALVLTASPYGNVWGAGPRVRNDARVAISAASPEEATARLPELLSALRMPSRPIAETCVGVIADQSLSIGEVVAFHNDLEALGVRRVGYFPMAAED